MKSFTTLAATPPMGWNSWNTFGAHVTEVDVRETAEALVTSGLAESGYRYVVIDDFWEADERVDGRLTWNPLTFPSGIPALAEYVHGKGLKFGIYSCAGTHTCGGKPASFRNEEVDARTFAEWGVDYLKYDFCFHPPQASGPASYRRMGQALRQSGRAIVFSLCNWGFDDLHKWARSVGGHLWRTTGDIQDKWASIYDIGFRKQPDLAVFAGPGGWNDPDMLVVGMRGAGNAEVVHGSEGRGCSDDEYQTHFALWCMLAAPLMIGADVRKLDDSARAILGNRALIAINQDPMGVQATRIGAHRNVEVWIKPLANGDIAVGFFNLGPDERCKTPVSWESLGLADTAPCRVRNLITGEDCGVRTRSYNSGVVRSHACEVVRIEPGEQA
jgi:alpha-galactosidase